MVEKIKLKFTEKLTLAILNKNSRLSNKNIAELVGISPERCFYLIESLQKRKIISCFKTGIDLRKLGYENYTVYFRLKKVSREIEAETLDLFTKNPYITWVGKMFGSYDFRCIITVTDTLTLNRVLAELSEKLDHNISAIMIFNRLERKAVDNMFYLLDSKEEIAKLSKVLSKIENFQYKDIGSFSFDTKDIEIIKSIYLNSQETYTNIARKLGISIEDVRIRYKKILTKGIINGYTISINHTSLGYLWWTLLIKKTNLDFNTFASEVLSLKESHNIMSVMHEHWNFEITFSTKTLYEAQEYIFALREKCPDILQYETLLNSEQLKIPQASPELLDMYAKRSSINSKDI